MLDSNTLTIIFGLTSGILSLVGLTAIFVSINSQHSIQKGRELLWNIMSLPLDIEDYTEPKNANILCHYYWLYKDIIGSNSGFTQEIVSLSKIAMLVVCGFWIIGIPFYYYSLNIVQLVYVITATVFSFIILLRYRWILGKLSNISKIANLPEYDSLLDGNAHHELNINITALTGIGSYLKITKYDKEYRLSVGTALPFKNISVIPIVYALNTDNKYMESLCEPICGKFIAFSINGEGYLSLGSYIWYDLNNFLIDDDVRGHANRVNIQLEFSSTKGSSFASYDIPMEILINLDFGSSEYILPNDVGNNYVACADGTIVPWGLN